MAKARSVLMLSSTGSAMSQYSTEIPIVGSHCNRDSVYSIQVIYNDYVGRFRIQGSLALAPTVSDWVDIIPDTTTGDFFNPAGYIQWNLDLGAPTTSDDNYGSGNISELYTFKGNYTFLRVYMDRSYIGLPSNNYSISYGQISRAILSR